jgi:hypothetical protein
MTFGAMPGSLDDITAKRIQIAGSLSGEPAIVDR